ncbi:hypothetical protein [Reinekea sp. G2M2-21]|uniref:hypothetical protein n=1 Tax=Reinekea sp. G2M2-21 TaxID=2788942 RepID=UPI0018AC83C0|nr:hypothetical protein [Reinekea sp. G2M2-21]
MNIHDLMAKLSSVNATEFVDIASTYSIGSADGIVIHYQIGDVELSITFAVSSDLTIAGDPVVVQDGEIQSTDWSAEAKDMLSNHFCTGDLYVLIKRYQFLFNSSKRDDSLHEFFMADARGEKSKIKFYPLMNLVTAYYESH